jgi:hypothetical protein
MVQKLLLGDTQTDRQTDRQAGDLLSLTFLFKESRLKSKKGSNSLRYKNELLGYRQYNYMLCYRRIYFSVKRSKF